MRKSILLLSSVLLTIITLSCEKEVVKEIQQKPIDYVDPFIGTGGIVHTFPGATIPFSMIQLSPDTDTKGWDHCSGYHYNDSTIKGFSHTHLSGTGWSDLGDILIMPTVGDIQLESGPQDQPDLGWRSRFSHDEEIAEPGFYEVNLKDYGITAALTAGQRVGFHKYTFPATDSANIIIDPTNLIFGEVLETQISTDDPTEIVGYCKSNGWGGKRYVYFIIKFTKPYDKFQISRNGKISSHLKVKDKDVKGFATFKVGENDPIEVKVAISAVSLDGARKNLLSEGHNSFALAVQHAQEQWSEVLNKFSIDGGTEEQKRIFYTGIYHNFIAPNLSMDVDGKYVAMGKKLEADGFTNYSNFSTWDTFRATKPLISFLTPNYSADFVESLISRHRDAKEHLPLWELAGFDNTCMIGYPSVPVIYEAMQKDVKGIDVNEALAAMDDIAHFNKISSSDGDGGLNEYIKLGYVPAHIPKNVSKTLEYAYEDWVIAQVAQKAGNKKLYEKYMQRAQNFTNLYHPEKKTFWPRKSNGQWFGDIEMDQWEPLQKHWISGNKWAYDYFVPQAISQFIEMKGGKDAFAADLDTLFSQELDMKGEEHVDISGFIGSYAHGDEPGHANAYLYNFAGQPWKTQAMIRRIMDEMYSDKPDGMINNEDCGQMSAWYVFSAMGFYPVCPGDKQYIIGSPLFDRVSMQVSNGKTFTVEAKNQSDKNVYIQAASLNGKDLDRSYITQEEIMAGGILKFVMGPEPNKNWGTDVNDIPKSPIQ
ncbi:GH92 family glycosyl hydrolase [Flammeovirga agarivorans]|uniref:Glycoside hydrolase family 92 protein n=1 Tax=Flammeovirga agarivorans TaxID=2726742 RepID=A0A7X8SNP8_9BACT|nr:GH92 family glycosyl hydrolase [Flammeovirga agarivorans]NLR93584.1 glycoside hydrolase family 92 protein [Flammeovirga agarivorans]